MKKWILIILAVLTFPLFFNWQQGKYDIKYSPSRTHSIYYEHGSEHQDLPYAVIAYLEKHSFISFFNHHEFIFKGYCKPNYKWISNDEILLVCHTDKSHLTKENTFGIKVEYVIYRVQ